MIAHEIVEAVLPLCEGKTIRRVVCGSGFTGVQLNDGNVGVSYRYPGLELVRYVGTMAGRPAADLVHLIVEGNLQEASIGYAAINALTAAGREGLAGGNIYDYLDLKETDVVGVIGDFGRFLNPIRQKCRKLMIFELAEGPDYYPVWSEPLHLPECDIVIITGATLINRTIDAVLANSTKARQIVLMGPTAVQLPEVFAKHGVTLLAGAETLEGERALEMIQEGANGGDLLPYRRSYCVVLEPPEK